MLYGLIIFLSFLLLGEFISSLLGWPVPGSVMGMLMLFLVLVIRGGVGTDLKKSSDGLLPYLPLFIVPASVGIVNHLSILQQDGLALAVAMVVSLLVGIPVCGVLAQWSMSLINKYQGKSKSGGQ